MKIAVAGTGYVGLSMAVLLSQNHEVTAVDIIPEKVEKINNRISPIQDDEIENYLATKKLNLTATLDGKSAYKNADFIIIAAPTNYDSETRHFDTSAVEDAIEQTLAVNADAVIIIKTIITIIAVGIRLLITPNITTRGFILVNENEELIHKIENKAEQTILNALTNPKSTFATLKSDITDALYPFISNLTGRKPIILPIILDIKKENTENIEIQNQN